MGIHSLKVKPEEPTAPKPVEEITELPLWAIRLISNNRSGKHGKKYPKDYYTTGPHRGYSSMGPFVNPTSNGYGWGMSGDVGVYSREDADDYEKQWKDHVERAAREDEAANRFLKEVPVGCFLHDDDWKYYSTAKAWTVVNPAWCCRWCQRWIYSEEQKVEHQRCNYHQSLIRIVSGYIASIDSPWWCMVCNSSTTFIRWGFPICRSVKCVTEFKFGSEKHLATSMVRWLNIIRSAKPSLLDSYYQGVNEKLTEWGTRQSLRRQGEFKDGH